MKIHIKFKSLLRNFLNIDYFIDFLNYKTSIKSFLEFLTKTSVKKLLFSSSKTFPSKAQNEANFP